MEIEAEGDERRPDLWLTLDTSADLRAISAIYDGLYDGREIFGYADILEFLDDHPEVAELNQAPV